MTPLLHERMPGLRDSLPHVALGTPPTPVRRLHTVSAGDAEVWVKDEGPFGDGPWGGNKVRKLEWILPDAKRRESRTVLTFGALATNHGLATALYAREQGLRAALVLLDQPIDDHVRAQLKRLEASGATLHFTHTKPRTARMLPRLIARHTSGRHLPYLLPAGGSSAVGALGYVEAAFEIAEQVATGELPEPSHVVVALGSGGTSAGLALGLRLAGLRSRLVGIVVNDQLRLDEKTTARLAGRSARLLRRRGASLPADAPGPGDVTITRRFLGPGYGHATSGSERAREVARGEGLALDPVYTAKAFGGALALGEEGAFGPGPVLFVNTHGPREDRPPG